ncbi:hypothetical protein [Prochlorococcus sp. MIT 0714]|uniref:hypothetical protein n=1 Tax=Prochlorococcus sp. MIT 0714 TaxID=3082540 RepID=UPI0039B04D13
MISGYSYQATSTAAFDLTRPTTIAMGLGCSPNQIPEDWHHVAVKFRRDNGIRGSDL